MSLRARIKIIGRRRLERDVAAAAVKLEPVMARNLRKAGEIIIGAARKQFKGSRTRALYRIKGGRKVRRKPPRPITSPPRMLGIWTGQYRKAISQDVRRVGRKKWSAEIGPVGIPYARVHEFGIGRMPKRPVLEPALKKTRRKVFALIGASFRVLR